MFKGISFYRKLALSLLSIIFIASFAVSASAADKASLEKKVEKNFKENLAKRGMKNINLDAEVISELEMIKGYYFVKVNIDDQSKGKKATDYMITNGKYLLPDVIDITEGKSLKSSLAFEYDTYDIDTKNLSLVYGDRSDKNVIVDISDFQCPYCRKAHDYIKDKVEGMDDVAIYLVHMPLKIHDKAVFFAKLFEAGKVVGSNFSDELYSGKYDDMQKDKVINAFAAKTNSPEKFKKLLDSQKVMQKIEHGKELSKELGVSSTPVLFFNGRKVEGYNTKLMDKGIELFQ